MVHRMEQLHVRLDRISCGDPAFMVKLNKIK